MKLTSTLLLLLLATSTFATITTVMPPNSVGPSDGKGNPATPKIAPGVAGLTPTTNKWWSSLIWRYDDTVPYGESIWAWPLSFKATKDGLNVCYPTTRYVSPYTTTPLGQKVHEFKHAICSDITVRVIDESGANVDLGTTKGA